MFITITIGEKLRQLRNIHNLTLRGVEKKTGISNGYLNQLEQGKIKEPSPHILHKLAEFYNVRYESLLELAGYLIPSKDKRGHSRKAAGIAFSRSIDLTADEEEELLNYLEYIRQKRRSKG